MVFPSYDNILKCSHTFNVLDARGAISVSERAHYIARVRDLARMAANLYLEKNGEKGGALLPAQKTPQEFIGFRWLMNRVLKLAGNVNEAMDLNLKKYV